jgi:hypothetical protein
MDVELTSNNPTVKAIVSGTAPRPAQLAAARGILPLPQTDLLEVLVSLAQTEDAELAESAQNTLATQDKTALGNVVGSNEIAPRVLAYFVEREDLSKEIHEAILNNPRTPTAAVLNFARKTADGDLLELLSFNQQLLIGSPQIIEAIIGNPYRTAEAERRAAEIKSEFFEKDRGAQQIAGELRARGNIAAAEFIENSEFSGNLQAVSSATNLSFSDAILLAEHIEVPDSEVDDSWLSLEYIEEFYEETEEERLSVVNKILGELHSEDDEMTGERVSMINRIMRMGMKDRVKLAMKGDREARNILIRDPNRIVSQAVINNQRITEQEVEKIATMRTVPEDILRQIAINRAWLQNYQIMHNLARNPRTPLANVVTIMNRLQLKDLNVLSKNRNVSDTVRRQAFRLVSIRSGRK